MNAKLVKREGFKKAVYDRLNSSCSLRQAYEDTEKEYEKTFGERKYSSYDSWRVTNSRK